MTPKYCPSNYNFRIKTSYGNVWINITKLLILKRISRPMQHIIRYPFKINYTKKRKI